MSDRVLFSILGALYVVTLILAEVFGAAYYASTCVLAPKLDTYGKYVGPELHCPLPPWLHVG